MRQIYVVGILLFAGSVWDISKFVDKDNPDMDVIFNIPLPILIFHAINIRFALLCLTVGAI